MEFIKVRSSESACSAGGPGLIPGLRRSPGEGIGYPLQYSGLENPMDCIAQSIGSQRVRHDWVTFTLFFGICLKKFIKKCFLSISSWIFPYLYFYLIISSPRSIKNHMGFWVRLLWIYKWIGGQYFIHSVSQLLLCDNNMSTTALDSWVVSVSQAGNNCYILVVKDDIHNMYM